nr:C2 calcium/lipid-binding domain, CaLB [Tanacetum cinerariifolium]
MSHESDDDLEYDPSDVEFTEWLASKIFNYKTMDHYTMKSLWIYWARGDDEVELTDEESSASDDKDEVAKIFRIKTNVFNFETPLCRAFKEFNYLLQIDPDMNQVMKDGKDRDAFEINNHNNEECENEMEHEEEERREVFDDHESLVCYIRRIEMIKYSFRDDEEYVAIKENEYDDLTNTSKDEIHTYQEIFRMMDEGWMLTSTE